LSDAEVNKFTSFDEDFLLLDEFVDITVRLSTFFSFTLGKLRFVASFRFVIFDLDDSGGWGGLAINEEEDDDDDEEDAAGNEEDEQDQHHVDLFSLLYIFLFYHFNNDYRETFKQVFCCL
jgi:hypothetical protein